MRVRRPAVASACVGRMCFVDHSHSWEMGAAGALADLALINVVGADLLQDLALHEVPDAALGHDRDGHCRLDRLDHLRVGHARDASVLADVCRHTLERHDSARARLLCDPGLLDVHDVHDDATLEHLRHASLRIRVAAGRL